MSERIQSHTKLLCYIKHTVWINSKIKSNQTAYKRLKDAQVWPNLSCSLAQGLWLQWHQRWCWSLEKWECGEFLLCPVSQCRTGDNVSTVRINLPQLRAEIKAIHESGTTWYQCWVRWGWASAAWTAPPCALADDGTTGQQQETQVFLNWFSCILLEAASFSISKLYFNAC